MVYRILGGIFLTLLGAAMVGFTPLSQSIVGIIGILAGISLLAGI